jgi:hypothetical protein
MKKLMGVLLVMAGLSGAAMADSFSLSLNFGDGCYRRPYYRSYSHCYRPYYYSRSPVIYYGAPSYHGFGYYPRHGGYSGHHHHHHHHHHH